MTSKIDIPSSSFSPPPFRKLTYDVFLSFRGEDTRNNFTDNLYTALTQRGIFTFRDDEELKRGESVGPSLLKAIEESRYVIVIFSKNYANSSWCLDETAKVAECMEATGQEVFPVFYHVDPSEVRKQTGEHFGKAFEKHQKCFEEDKVQRWRDALLQVGNLSGWHIKDGYESKFIQEVVEQIFTKLNQIISTSEGLVGMDSHLKKMFSYLDIGCPDVRIIGICGMGGIGKTTIAEMVYERIRPQFESSCFLAHVREESEKNGVVHLQQKLLFTLLNTDVNVEYTKMGKDMILHRLCTKKVLLVLDDVDQAEQLEALCNRTWLGPGSRIIITSRDEHLLSVAEGDQVYKVSPLTDAQAFQLFSMKAFKKDQLIGEDMIKLVKEFLSYADGLPLAIEILGSSVKGRRIGLWPSMLDRLKNNPEKKLIKVLRVSFDGLEQREKQIFLDIACFFKGMSVDCVRRILQGSDAHCPDLDLEVLLDKSMIILIGRKLWMHDMIQELGWEVVRQECPNKPGERSRLWISNEIIRVLDRSKATSTVQSVSLEGPTNDDVVHSLNDSFSEMDNLRLLRICDVKFSGNIKYLSTELQYLEWDECPLESFPSNFQPDNLVELHMPSSRIHQLWRGEQGWSMLRFIDLNGSKYLLSTPDFSEVPHLESLNLKNCISLVNIHPSLGCLKKLESLDMTNCKSVKSLPPFTNMESLHSLNISLCSSLEKFPEIEGDMKSLLHLFLGGTNIKELPTSVECLTGLTLLNLSNCKNLLRLPSAIRCLTSMKTLSVSGCLKINDIPDGMDFVECLHIGGTSIRDLSFVIGMKNLIYLSCRGCKGLTSESCKALHPLWSLTSLMELDLSDCNLTDGAIPSDLRSLISLTSFNLSGNCFVLLPDGISQLSKLETLILNNCKQLQLVPKLPSRVRMLHANGCDSLRDFPNQFKILTSPESGVTVINSLTTADATLGNTKIDQVRSFSLHGDRSMYFQGKTVSENSSSTEWKQQVNEDDSSARLSLQKDLELVSSRDSIASVFPGDEIPEWFSTKFEGDRILIPIPPNLRQDNKWQGVAVCAVFLENRRTSSGKQLFQCTLGTDLFKMEPAFVEWDEEQFITSLRSYSHLRSIFYIPKWKFPQSLDQSVIMLAKFETRNPSGSEIQICGIRLVYEQDAQWYAKLHHQDKKCTLLNEVYSSIRNSGWLSRVDTFWKWEPCTPPVQEDSIRIMQRKNIESVLPRYLEAERCVACFMFGLSGCPGWCMYTFDDGPLPRNLHKCKKWMGIVVYASIAEKELHTSEEDYHIYLKLSVDDRHHLDLSVVYVKSSEEPHQLLFIYIPREQIIQEFTQTSEITLRIALCTDCPGVEFERRGFKIVDQPEGLKEFVEAIIHCMEREDTLAPYNKWVAERWIDLLRMQGDLCTPNRCYSRARRERKFELLSQKYRKWDWSASMFHCSFFGAEFCRKIWSMHFNQGNSAQIQLPPNLLGDPNWLGIAVCAIHWMSHEVQDIILDTPYSEKNVLSWHLEFYADLDCLCTFRHDQPIQKLRRQDLLVDWTYYVYVPGKRLKLWRQCLSGKVTFWSSSPYLGVRSCALRLVYKEDIEDLVQSLTLCELP